MSRNPYPLDGAHREVYAHLLQPDSPPEETLRGFVVFLHAAAEASNRFGDELDLGKELSEDERAEWFGYTHLLLAIADLHTWGSDGTRGEVAAALEELAEKVREGDR